MRHAMKAMVGPLPGGIAIIVNSPSGGITVPATSLATEAALAIGDTPPLS